METIHDGDLSGCDVSDHLRDEEGIELRTLGLMDTIVFHLVLEGLNSTNTNAIDHADTIHVLCLQVHATILDSLLGSNHSQLCITVHLTGLFAVKILVHVEVLYLAGKLGLE